MHGELLRSRWRPAFFFLFAATNRFFIWGKVTVPNHSLGAIVPNHSLEALLDWARYYTCAQTYLSYLLPSSIQDASYLLMTWVPTYLNEYFSCDQPVCHLGVAQHSLLPILTSILFTVCWSFGLVFLKWCCKCCFRRACYFFFQELLVIIGYTSTSRLLSYLYNSFFICIILYSYLIKLFFTSSEPSGIVKENPQQLKYNIN